MSVLTTVHHFASTPILQADAASLKHLLGKEIWTRYPHLVEGKVRVLVWGSWSACCDPECQEKTI